MRKFKIAIKETIIEEFEVEANSEEEALSVAQSKYRSGEFVLAPGEVLFKEVAINKPEGSETEWFEF